MMKILNQKMLAAQGLRPPRAFNRKVRKEKAAKGRKEIKNGRQQDLPLLAWRSLHPSRPLWLGCAATGD
jgi:hypothetical protein